MTLPLRLVVSLLAGGTALTAQLQLPAAGQPAFAGSAFRTGGGRVCVAVDLDADGYADSVLASNRVVVALNNAHGVVRKSTDLQGLPSVSDMAPGDLNGDGDVDLVISPTSASNPVTTLLGDGAGHVAVAGQQPAPASSSLALADVNLDGRLDVVAGHGATGWTLNVLLGNGDGTLAPSASVGTSGFIMGVAAGDWDHDGDADVFAGATGSVRLLVGDGLGGFTTGSTSTQSPGEHVALTDVDGDGFLDALNDHYTATTGGTLVYRRQVSGGFSGPVVIVTGGGLLDVERNPADGFADVLVGGGSTVRVLVNTGLGFSAKPAIQVLAGVDDASFGQFDGDTVSDVLCSSSASQGGTVLFPSSAGVLQAPPHVSAPAGSPNSAVLADLNGDGRLDLLTTDSTPDLAVALGVPGPGFFGTWSGVPSSGGAEVRLVDFDADGDLDVVAGGESTFCAHAGDGAGHFGPVHDSDTLPGFSKGFDAGDLDGDGLADAVRLMTAFGTTLETLHGLGTGDFQPALGTAVDAATTDFVLGDVDLDGALDAVIVRGNLGSPNADALAVLSGDGAGGFAAPTAITQSLTMRSELLVTDFDADGQPDIAASCSENDASVAVFLGVPGGFAAPVVGGFGRCTVQGLIAVDVDDDAAPDLVHSTDSEAMVVVVRGDGSGGLRDAVGHPSAQGEGESVLAAGDIDLDGRTDLLHLATTNWGNDFVVLLRNTTADNVWASIGGGIPGATGQPRAIGLGQAIVGQMVGLDVDHAAPLAPSFLALGTALLAQSFKGGYLVPQPTLLIAVGATDGAGKLHLADTWPAGIPSGLEIWLQLFSQDATALHGLSATGGMRLRVP